MSFKQIKRLWASKYPKSTSQRYRDLDAYDKMIAGDFYDILPYTFDKEKNGDQEIPLEQRIPSIQYNMPEMLSHQQASLLFGDKHRPSIRVYDPTQPDSPPEKLKPQQILVDAMHDQLDLDEVLIEAVLKGQSGSVALILSLLDDEKPYIDVVEGKRCTPKFDPTNPRRLMALEREYTQFGHELSSLGYSITDDDMQKIFWMRIVDNKAEEVWYMPMLNDKHERLGELDGVVEDGIDLVWR